MHKQIPAHIWNDDKYSAMLVFPLLRRNEVKEVSFECIGYSIKVRDQAQHGPARHGTARPEIGHAFAKLIIFLFVHWMSCNFAQW